MWKIHLQQSGRTKHANHRWWPAIVCERDNLNPLRVQGSGYRITAISNIQTSINDAG
jgi:hypothetical protein|tara:strand:- start:121 stop:291 length:171 start_codon:yes stop_codon:yes gene_type:complete